MNEPVVPTHGLLVDELRLGEVRVVEPVHRPAQCIAKHEHETVKICILIEGTYAERSDVELRSLRPNGVLVRASRRAHVNHYGGRGAPRLPSRSIRYRLRGETKRANMLGEPPLTYMSY